ncbi:hypothetical protein P7K49_038573 [Saguinus oedipus]|uniref:Uncharacterized protein n=1 Tax=Saguinus oedipus TaxID=9490 RepID=A0ABQ9TF24_SAGOE|nr:hypothetical protein P7K49_038573 [Saguinus oedipus]
MEDDRNSRDLSIVCEPLKVGTSMIHFVNGKNGSGEHITANKDVDGVSGSDKGVNNNDSTDGDSGDEGIMLAKKRMRVMMMIEVVTIVIMMAEVVMVVMIDVVLVMLKVGMVMTGEGASDAGSNCGGSDGDSGSGSDGEDGDIDGCDSSKISNGGRDEHGSGNSNGYDQDWSD